MSSSRSGVLVLILVVSVLLIGLARLPGPTAASYCDLAPTESVAVVAPRAAEPLDVIECAEPISARRAPTPDGYMESTKDFPLVTGRASFRTRREWPTGALKLSVVDAASGARVESVHLRAVSQARIADRQIAQDGGPAQLRLTPGTYALVASAEGYEPGELDGLRVEQDKTLEPAVLRLSPARARIRGQAVGIRAGRGALHAELSGSRRGLPESRERAELARDGSFAFERLVSGRYDLRLVDALEGTVGLPQAIELYAGQSASVEIEAASRTLEIELFDQDGQSLAPEWARRVRLQPDEDAADLLEIVSDSRGLEFACELREGGACYAKTTLAVPAPPGAARSSYGVMCIRCGGGRPAGGPDDRARNDGEGLWPELAAPRSEPPRPRAWIGTDGFARIEPLPQVAATLSLRCGSYFASAPIPASTETTRVRARLGGGETTFLEFEADAAPR